MSYRALKMSDSNHMKAATFFENFGFSFKFFMFSRIYISRRTGNISRPYAGASQTDGSWTEEAV